MFSKTGYTGILLSCWLKQVSKFDYLVLMVNIGKTDTGKWAADFMKQESPVDNSFTNFLSPIPCADSVYVSESWERSKGCVEGQK